MKKFILALTALGVLSGVAISVEAKTNPKKDLKAFRQFFFDKFPGVPLQEYANGIYGINPGRRVEWESTMEFPPFELGLEMGKELYEKDKAAYATCMPKGGIGIRQNYPKFDRATGKLITMEGMINDCRKKAGLKPYGWKKNEIAAVSAYLASTSNGKKIKVKIDKDPRSIAMYEEGKHQFYAKRGQLNFSCANCHVYTAGGQIRGNILSPALGHVTHFPVYRKKWEVGGKAAIGGFGTLHRRYGGCNKQVRAKPFKAQGKEYLALEYFHTYMSNGIAVNAPGVRQ
jgi:sulfur-oxidizing protein SoxA